MSQVLIQKAIKQLGSQAKLAEACGVKQQSIWQAKKFGRVSAELAVLINTATVGKVTAAELRPDLPWSSLQPQAPDQNDQHQHDHADGGPSPDPVDAHGASS